MTEWHTRYRGHGVMIYWHVDKNAACIYSQLKTCSSSEVGAMMQGILRHATKMELKKGYVDTHGQHGNRIENSEKFTISEKSAPSLMEKDTAIVELIK